MNNAEFSKRVASQTFLPRAAADSAVNALFSATGEALSREKPSSSPVRNLHHQEARPPPGAQSPYRRAHRHRGVEGAGVQGRLGPSVPAVRHILRPLSSLATMKVFGKGLTLQLHVPEDSSRSTKASSSATTS